MKVKHEAAAHKAPMTVVSVSDSLGSELYFYLVFLLIMAWYNNNNRLYRVLEWLWRRLGILWRCMRRTFTAVLAYRPAFLPLRWRKEDEPETNDENKLPESRFHPEDVEKSRREEEARYEAVAAEKRAAESRREGVWKRQKFEDSNFTEDSNYTEDEDEEESEDKSEDESEDEGEDESEDKGEDEEEFDGPEYRVQTSDELYCGYDSTWETEEHQRSSFRGTRQQATPRHHKFRRFEAAAKDMQNYRQGYPSQMKPQRRNKTQSNDKPNLNFYLGRMASVPDGVYIQQFHDKWHGEYDTLEYVHSYIQWLFPLQEPGMNSEASTLTKQEINEFCQSSTAKENLLKSYKLMLDFYGIRLRDEKTGEVERADNWRERFYNLNRNTHNNLRITRILKCQGTLGFQHYQVPLVRFFLEETLVHGELPDVKDSVLNYFVFAVLDKRQRRRLLKYAYLKYDRKDEFVWCPKKIQKIWSGLPVSTEPQRGEDEEFLSSDEEMKAD